MLIVEMHSNNVLTLRDDTFSNAVSKSVNHETVKFLFPRNWEHYQKTAVFSADGVEPLNVMLNSENELCVSENECYIPFEVLESESFFISVFGVDGNSIATATRVQIEVLESGYALGDSPSVPTEGEYAQIINIMRNAQDIAQSVRDDADLGLFKGEKGDKGDMGDCGVYYGTTAPTDPTHPLWVNPAGTPYGDIKEDIPALVDEVVDEIARNKIDQIINRIVGTRHTLVCNITNGAKWNKNSSAVYLYGNSLVCYFNATRSESTVSGDIPNEIVCSFSVEHNGKIKAASPISFCSGAVGGVSTFFAGDVSVSSTALNFNVYLSATASSFKDLSVHFIVPVVIDVNSYN